MNCSSLHLKEPSPAIIVDLPVLDFNTVWNLQKTIVTARKQGRITEDVILFVEHEPVFTLGKRGKLSNFTVSREFITDKNIDIVEIERGGDITFHGPGQIVVYPILDLNAKGFGVADYVSRLEGIMIAAAGDLGVKAERDNVNRGVYVGGKKIGSVGVAVQKGISFHGLALNVNMSLEPFSWIHPCGLRDISMTRMADESPTAITMTDALDKVRHHVMKKLHILPEPMDYQDLLKFVGSPLAKKSKPAWLRRRLPSGADNEAVRNLIKHSRLNTVCQEAKCPNQFECFSNHTATFLIMGDRCTRNCRFCAVGFGPSKPPDPEEPQRVAESAETLNLKYVVVTSVTRDDLSDGGAGIFADTIRELKKKISNAKVEVLIPDFRGNLDALKTVLDAGPDVLNHNIETVPRLYKTVRPEAVYSRSLALLKDAGEYAPAVPLKSGLMLGLGETAYEIEQVLADLFAARCRMLTIGQYLQPTKKHLPVDRYVPPEEYDEWRRQALDMGFTDVASGPFVRSSYQAEKMFTSAHPEMR